jgi:acyl-coenzyme A synthetase/AMP-(fatty) acid ligase
MNIVDPISFHCRSQPEALAICAPGIDLVTYERLEKTVNNILRRAVSVGLAPGQVVALFVRQPVIHAATILALARLGVVTASIGGSSLPRRIHFDAILTDRGNAFPDIKTHLMDLTWMSGDGQPADLKHVVKGSDICRILVTSGTTGEAKGVAVTHDMILGRISRYSAIYGSKAHACSRIFCDLAWGTTLAFQLFIYTLGKGGAFFVRGDTPANTLRAFEFYRVDHFVASPAGFAEFLVEYDKHRCRHTIDIVHSAGGALSKFLSDRVRGRIGSNLISDYGSAETSCTAAAPISAIESFPGAVGYVTPGMTIEIIDEGDRPLPTGAEGLVRIRGDYMASEYVNDEETSRQFFRNGWFYPGDLGSITREGLLIISGRQKSILNVGGEKIKPEAIEDVLASFAEGVQGAALAVVNQLGVEEVWALIVSRQQIDETRLRQHCQNKLASIFVPKKFIMIEKLPRNEMGKLDRSQIARMVQPN